MITLAKLSEKYPVLSPQEAIVPAGSLSPDEVYTPNDTSPEDFLPHEKLLYGFSFYVGAKGNPILVKPHEYTLHNLYTLEQLCKEPVIELVKDKYKKPAVSLKDLWLDEALFDQYKRYLTILNKLVHPALMLPLDKINITCELTPFYDCKRVVSSYKQRVGRNGFCVGLTGLLQEWCLLNCKKYLGFTEDSIKQILGEKEVFQYAETTHQVSCKKEDISTYIDQYTETNLQATCNLDLTVLRAHQGTIQEELKRTLLQLADDLRTDNKTKRETEFKCYHIKRVLCFIACVDFMVSHESNLEQKKHFFDYLNQYFTPETLVDVRQGVLFLLHRVLTIHPYLFKEILHQYNHQITHRALSCGTYPSLHKVYQLLWDEKKSDYIPLWGKTLAAKTPLSIDRYPHRFAGGHARQQALVNRLEKELNKIKPSANTVNTLEKDTSLPPRFVDLHIREACEKLEDYLTNEKGLILNYLMLTGAEIDTALLVRYKQYRSYLAFLDEYRHQETEGEEHSVGYALANPGFVAEGSYSYEALAKLSKAGCYNKLANICVALKTGNLNKDQKNELRLYRNRLIWIIGREHLYKQYDQTEGIQIEKELWAGKSLYEDLKQNYAFKTVGDPLEKITTLKPAGLADIIRRGKP